MFYAEVLEVCDQAKRWESTRLLAISRLGGRRRSMTCRDEGASKWTRSTLQTAASCLSWRNPLLPRQPLTHHHSRALMLKQGLGKLAKAPYAPRYVSFCLACMLSVPQAFQVMDEEGQQGYIETARMGDLLMNKGYPFKTKEMEAFLSVAKVGNTSSAAYCLPSCDTTRAAGGSTKQAICIAKLPRACSGFTSFLSSRR